ncbi:hypothetical protein [Streptomyces sp. NPDC046925]|uniref:hypothetical protein n=1 Tax=Streptomyces sp. NPDC046925 TaxID=3155375 RepID=UPI0033DA8BD7
MASCSCTAADEEACDPSPFWHSPVHEGWEHGEEREVPRFVDAVLHGLSSPGRPLLCWAPATRGGRPPRTSQRPTRQAHLGAAAPDFADEAEEMALRLAGHPQGGGRPSQLSAGQCALYRIGIHRHLGDVDTALARAARLDPQALPTAERRARAATDTARTLLDAGAFAQLRLVELAAPGEARRPSVCALTVEVAEARPGLQGLDAYARRTALGSKSSSW